MILSRKEREQINIGDNITIVVKRVHGQAVRIGIEAPRHVKILRGEVLEDVRRVINGSDDT